MVYTGVFPGETIGNRQKTQVQSPFIFPCRATDGRGHRALFALLWIPTGGFSVLNPSVFDGDVRRGRRKKTVRFGRRSNGIDTILTNGVRVLCIRFSHEADRGRVRPRTAEFSEASANSRDNNFRGVFNTRKAFAVSKLPLLPASDRMSDIFLSGNATPARTIP